MCSLQCGEEVSIYWLEMSDIHISDQQCDFIRNVYSPWLTAYLVLNKNIGDYTSC